jgi:hypothetical protein
MKRLARNTAWLLGLLALGIAAIALLSWRSPPFYEIDESRVLPAPILTQEQYEAVHESFPRPYVVDCAAGKGRVVLYGASHTRDLGDPQIADLEARFAELRPSVVLVEGRPGGPLVALDPVGRLGEGGAAIRDARRAGVPVYSWEPSREAEVGAQLARFPRQHVALFYVLRPYVSSLRFGKPKNPDADVEAIRRRRSQWKGLEGALADVAAIDAIWKRDFAGLPDWRDTSDEYGWPGYLGEIAHSANEIRDEHFARLLVELLARGERVLAVAGSSHAVRLEPVLAAACGEPFGGTLTR